MALLGVLLYEIIYFVENAAVAGFDCRIDLSMSLNGFFCCQIVETLLIFGDNFVGALFGWRVMSYDIIDW